MPLISLVINCDTRNEKSSENGLFSGTVNLDYLTDGIYQKKKFLEGFDFETIVYVDKHQEIPEDTLRYLNSIADIVCIRKHTDEPSFNCWNYWRALSLATGNIIIHADQDTNMYRENEGYVAELLSYLDTYRMVSYPSHWTPYPTHDDSFGGKFWTSTRFFICKKETLKLNEIAKCIKNPDWMYEKYGDSPRRVNWFEHYLAKVNDNDVFYPPMNLHKGAIFSWKTYNKYTIQRLNEMPYEYVKQWILHRGGIVYPCDCLCD